MSTIPVDMGAPQGTPGERLREAMKRKRMSARKLARLLAGERASAEQVEARRSAVQKYLAGDIQPSPTRAKELVEHLGGTVEWYRDEKPPVRNWRTQIAADLEAITASVRSLQQSVPDAGLSDRLAAVEDTVREIQRQRAKAGTAGTQSIAALQRLFDELDARVTRLELPDQRSSQGNGQ